MIKTRTDLWTMALMSSLGIFAGGCGSRSTDTGSQSTPLSDAGPNVNPTTDPTGTVNTATDDSSPPSDATASPTVPTLPHTGTPKPLPSDDAVSAGGAGPVDDTEPTSDPTDPTGPGDTLPTAGDAGDVTLEPTEPTDVVDPTDVTQPGSDAGVSPQLGSCEDGTPILQGAIDTGLVQCASGAVHRPEPVACPNNLAARPGGPLEEPSEACSSDADCVAEPLGRCDFPPNLGNALPARACIYGCETDADCGESQLCVCGPEIGQCVSATCQSAADCGDGLLCTQHYDRVGIGCGEQAQYACQTPEDQCATEADCAGAGEFGGNCAVGEDGTRSCIEMPGVACGRPFLVMGEQRLAAVCRAEDWQAPLTQTPHSLELSAEQREQLGVTWSEIGLMEHASIAAFARFTLQLLQLGAPSALIEASQQAMLDETRHAKLCFALASHYLERPCGPSALNTQHALDDGTLQDIVRLVFREGCVGETLAALEAAEALAHCEDAAVSAVLRGISVDERAHAELAWRFVAWALEQEPSLKSVIEAELTQASRFHADSVPSETSAFDTLPHGVISSELRGQVRATALRDIVLPCAHGLLARGQQQLGFAEAAAVAG